MDLFYRYKPDAIPTLFGSIQRLFQLKFKFPDHNFQQITSNSLCISLMM